MDAAAEGSALTAVVLGAMRSQKRAVIDAQADLLQEGRRGVASEYADYPPGWSHGTYLRPSQGARAWALQYLAPDPREYPTPAWPALRRFRRESEHNQRFLGLMWDGRPKLAAAVALWWQLAAEPLHPELLRRWRVEKAREVATLEFERTLAGGRLFSPEFSRAVTRFGEDRDRWEILDRRLLQLRDLGWGGWDVPDDAQEPTAPKSGGEPMPCWMLASSEPEELDGGVPDDMAAWWAVDAPNGDVNGRKGKTLRTYTVAALLDALGLRDEPNTVEHRTTLAAYVPDPWTDHRDTGSRALLARDVERVQQRG